MAPAGLHDERHRRDRAYCGKCSVGTSRSWTRRLASAPPGAAGITFLPYLSGERTPNLPNGVGVFHGLTTANMTPANLARATMEGVTLGLAYGLNRFRSLGIKPSEIRLTGGGSKSRIWRQICADIFRIPVVCLATAEGAALGAAMHGAWVDRLVNNKSANLVQLLDTVVKLDESSRAVPATGHSRSVPGYLQPIQRPDSTPGDRRIPLRSVSASVSVRDGDVASSLDVAT